MPADRIADVTAMDGGLSTRHLNLMRIGYAFIGVGLAVVKWPVLIQNAPSLPVMEGVVACLLTAMSLLAFLGLKYPLRMLPILLFEVIWKVIWIAVVGRSPRRSQLVREGLVSLCPAGDIPEIPIVDDHRPTYWFTALFAFDTEPTMLAQHRADTPRQNATIRRFEHAGPRATSR